MNDSTSLSIKKSVHISELLEDTTLCKRISVMFPDLQKILLHTQLAAVTEDNRDNVGPTLLALKHLNDVLFVFKTRGDSLIQQETKTNAPVH